MNIKQLDADDTRVPMTCNGLLISDIDSFAALMDVADEQAARHPGTMILLTLDELGQSEYTSGHAVSSLRLDDSDGYDTSKLDPAAYDNGEYRGDLATPSEFFILEGNFRKLCTGSDFAAACARGITIEDEELDALDAINADPALLLDSEVILRRVAVSAPSMMLSAVPNGYFSCDLDPSENYALAELLRERYDYTLFGMGAACIGFRRAAPLPAEAAQALGGDLARLYNCADDQARAARLAQLGAGRCYLLLKYVEYFDNA
ncbi:hypothetical protein INH39_26880 [Massilia violaceinigra]|uniref:Uncharacterized protein n=1 Tax=Massilia violaceinigra TaxID=2045208 RepID=A0ABY4A8T0_9BURK|nr:hypothetical protein [Massilia violaceinigra]UOD29018.1 hypothetical protein INH39_26880 [Massilia violaceinigra]